MIDELKIEDLKQQFIADVDKYSNLPSVKQKISDFSTGSGNSFLSDSSKSLAMFYSL